MEYSYDAVTWLPDGQMLKMLDEKEKYIDPIWLKDYYNYFETGDDFNLEMMFN